MWKLVVDLAKIAIGRQERIEAMDGEHAYEKESPPEKTENHKTCALSTYQQIR
jgi:hypothetical protein